MDKDDKKPIICKVRQSSSGQRFLTIPIKQGINIENGDFVLITKVTFNA